MASRAHGAEDEGLEVETEQMTVGMIGLAEAGDQG